MAEIWGEVVTVLGGYALLLGVLFWWLGHRTLQSALAKQKGEIEKDVNEHGAVLIAKQESELAKLQASIDVEASVRSMLMSSVSNTRPQILEKRMASIEALWCSMFGFRDSLPGFLTYVDIITEPEFKDWIQRTDFEEEFGDLSMETISKLATATTAEIERVRPFVGEYLWSLFFSYRAFLLRVVILVFFERAKDEPKFWKLDSGVNQILGAVLPQPEMTRFKAKEIGAIQYAQTLIERKFISHVEKVLSGDASIQEGLDQAHKIMTATEQVKNSPLTSLST